MGVEEVLGAEALADEDEALPAEPALDGVAPALGVGLAAVLALLAPDSPEEDEVALEASGGVVLVTAASPAAVLASALGLLSPLKSVTYQPEPLS